MPRVPSSRARLLPVDVAVDQRCCRAPDPVLLMGPDNVSSSYLSRWRFTLRRFLLDCSRAVSPRPLPSRTFTDRSVRVAALRTTAGVPHGFAPLSSSLRYAALPRRIARSFLGFASKQARCSAVIVADGAVASALEHLRRPQPHRSGRGRLRCPLGGSQTNLRAAGCGRSTSARPKPHLRGDRDPFNPGAELVYGLLRLFPPKWSVGLSTLRRFQRGRSVRWPSACTATSHTLHRHFNGLKVDVREPWRRSARASPPRPSEDGRSEDKGWPKPARGRRACRPAEAKRGRIHQPSGERAGGSSI